MTSTACGASPTSSSVGGPAPYWLDWTFDAAGDRASQVAHGSGSATGDTTTTYTYNGAGTGQPHVLTGVTSVGPAGTSTASYQYDGLGQTVSRPAQLGASAGTQTLTWDGEGHVATEKDSAGATSYVYDADGNRLIARTRGHTTAYLDSTELTLDKAAGTLSARRSYMFGGAMIAARNNGSVSFIATDLHDSGEIATDSSTLVSTPRRFDPYGNGRGVQPGSGSLAAWPSSHGFVNGLADGDGLTHLGAREYDPSIGRFISPDPLLDTGNPQQLNGYAYSDDAPTTQSTPRACAQDNPDTSVRHYQRQRPSADGSRGWRVYSPREKFAQDVAAVRQSGVGGYRACAGGCLAKVAAATAAGRWRLPATRCASQAVPARKAL